MGKQWTGQSHKPLCTKVCGPFGPFGAKKGLLDDNLMISCKEWTDQCTKVCAQTFVDLLGQKCQKDERKGQISMISCMGAPLDKSMEVCHKSGEKGTNLMISWPFWAKKGVEACNKV